jgi:hypothetical protein
MLTLHCQECEEGSIIFPDTWNCFLISAVAADAVSAVVILICRHRVSNL